MDGITTSGLKESTFSAAQRATKALLRYYKGIKRRRIGYILGVLQVSYENYLIAYLRKLGVPLGAYLYEVLLPE